MVTAILVYLELSFALTIFIGDFRNWPIRATLQCFGLNQLAIALSCAAFATIPQLADLATPRNVFLLNAVLLAVQIWFLESTRELWPHS
jgi:hypothetical protein